MNEQQEKAYFDAESLKKLIASEGRTVKGINCYLWQNSINPGDVLELIDCFEIVFTDGYKLSLSSNDEGSGMDAVDYNYAEEKKEIEKEFPGKIKLIGVTASATKMWTDVIGLKLESVQLTKADKNYLNDSVVFNFGEERRVVSISPLDGLIIDYHEED